MRKTGSVSEDNDKPTPVLEDAVEQLEGFYEEANQQTGGRLSVARWTFEQVGATRVSQAAAGIAYYALFSLFPLVLVMVVIGSFFVDMDAALAVVTETISSAFPNPGDLQALITNTVTSVFELRGEIGVISLIGLLWSASAAFTTLATNIDIAWSKQRARPALLQRVVGIVMIVALGGILILSLVLSTLLGIVFSRSPAALELLAPVSPWLQSLISSGITWGLSVLVFLGLYRWVPSARVPWPAAIVAALVASIAWQLANLGFSWYLSSGLARYELIYGSLTTIVVLMFWMYLSMNIVLIGAHLSASLARYREVRG